MNSINRINICDIKVTDFNINNNKNKNKTKQKGSNTCTAYKKFVMTILS